MYKQYALIILAGGKSSRMGQEKSDLLYQGKTFLEHQIQKGEKLGISEIVISGYQGGVPECRYPIIPDEVKERGPLQGIKTSMEMLRSEWVLVVSVDVPLVPTEELKRLLVTGSKTSARAVILSHRGKEEPLIGIYHKSLLPDMEQELLQGKGSVFGLLHKTGYETMEAEPEEKTPEHCFLNVNDPVSYQKLLQIKV